VFGVAESGIKQVGFTNTGMRVRQTQVSPGDGIVLLSGSVCKNDAV
jgi:hypothetical protein